MEKYKITIEKLTVVNEEKYPNRETIYEQTFTAKDDVIIQNVIKSVNGITVTY